MTLRLYFWKDKEKLRKRGRIEEEEYLLWPSTGTLESTKKNFKFDWLSWWKKIKNQDEYEEEKGKTVRI